MRVPILFYLLPLLMLACEKNTTCPEGYTGPDCSIQKTPTAVTVWGVTAASWPGINPTTKGVWDTSDDPDVYAEIRLKGAATANTTPIMYNIPGPPAIWSEIVWELDNPTAVYFVRLSDDDTMDSDDYIGGYEWTPYSSEQRGFPTTIRLAAPGYHTIFDLYITYQFE